MTKSQEQTLGLEVQNLKKRFEKNPADEEAFVRLWDVYVQTEDWPSGAGLLLARIPALDETREKVRALTKLANLLDDKLGDVRRAVEVYLEVLTLEPGNRRALWALSVLYHDLEEWEKVIEIYLLLIRQAESLEEKLSLRSQLASIYEQRLQQEDRALLEYIRAARLAPQNVRVLLNMEKLATRTESFRELLAIYEDVVERIERLELRVALYLKLARLYTLHLDDEDTAAGYYKRALELSTVQTDMLFSISNIYGEEEEWHELISIYTQLIHHAESPKVKSRVRREVARLYWKGLNDPTSAFYELLRVARYDPDEPGLVTELFELGIEAEHHLELASVMQDLAPRLAEPAEQARLYTRLARLYKDDLRKPDQARAALDRAVEIDLTRASQIDDPQEMVELLLSAAETLEEQLQDDGRAAAVYERILSLQPDAVAAQKALARLRGDAARVAEVHAEETEDREDVEWDDREPTLVEPAPDEQKEPTQVTETPPAASTGESMEEEELDDDSPMEEERTAPVAPMDPVQAMWQTVRTDPEDVEGWEKLAVLIAKEQVDEADAKSFDALIEGCQAVRNAEDQARLYRRMSMLAQTTALKLRLALLLEQSERPDDAESSFRSVLRSEPSRAEALDGLFRIYQARGALDRYDAILTRALIGVTAPAGRRALLLRRAGLRFRLLDRPSDALPDLEQLLLADDGDLEALALQEEILEAGCQYEELIQAYQQHLPFCLTSAERVDLLTAIAILYENQLDNTDEAIRHYSLALEEEPSHFSARDSLIKILQQRRDWLGAIEQLAKAIEVNDPPDLASQLRFRMGKILEEQLLRPEEAEQAYRDAVQGEAPSVEALRALHGMARRRGDWVDTIQLGKQIVGLILDPVEKASSLVELARIWSDRLDNEQEAFVCYEQALKADRDNLEAARVVAGRKLKDHRHAEAHELLARLAERGSAEGMSSEEMASVQLKLAQTAEALGLEDEAMQAYERALELAPADHQVLTQYGFFLSRRGSWQRAIDLYAEIIQQYGPDMMANEMADMRCLMAQGYAKLKHLDNAADQYRQALQVNPKHLPALRASIVLARQLGQLRECIDLIMRLRDLSTAPTGRLKLSIQIGDLLAEGLHEPTEAATAYREALEFEPDNAEILEKLRRALVHAELFEEAVAVLARLAHLAETDRLRARYLRIAGDIERERLDDDRSALVLYLKAIDSAPLDKRAHASAVKILTRLRDWPRLAKLNEELLHRLPPPIGGQENRRVPILTELIELYRYRLDDHRRAIGACEQLLAIDPGHTDQIKVREDLARLYETQGMPGPAIRMHRALIADSPFSIDSYHALRRIYESQGQVDHTLCISATLAFLDEADHDELSLLAEHRHALSIPPGRRMTETMYNRLLLHSKADGLVDEMFSFAADFARLLFTTPHKEYRLRPRDRIDLARAGSRVAEVIARSLEFLGLPAPEVYGKGVMIKGVMAVNTSPVAILYSEEAVKRASIPELRFMVARALTFTRPENLLAASLSARQLRTLLEALLELASPQGPIHPAPKEVSGLAGKLKRRIPSKKRDRLLQLTSQYREHEDGLSIRDWLEGVEHTCNRSGLAFCGDLEAAVQVLKAARVVSPTGSHRSLIREQIFYSISEEYFELRKSLNAAV